MTKFKSDFLSTLFERGFFHQCTNEEGFDAYVYECEKTSTPAVGYLGCDPTGDSLHVGHIVPVMMMRWFQKFGHKPLMLVGGATGRIGDPSGKDKLRPFLTSEMIEKNILGLKNSYEKFISFEDTPSGAEIVDNYSWFKDINYLDFLREVGTYYSVNRMLSMESVKARLDREQQMSFLEFNYQLLQGYDFCRLYELFGCRAQIAGSDQWGNITSGTELGRRKLNVELFGFTSPIITDSTGKKMGKSEGNAVWINQDKLSSYDYYQYFRNINDADIGKCLKIYTDLALDEISRLEDLKDKEINEAKKILAFEATKMCRGEQEALLAQETARQTFEARESGDSLPFISLSQQEMKQGMVITEVLTKLGLTSSKGEAKRLMAQGGVKVNDKTISDIGFMLDETLLQDEKIKVSVGKKKHALIKVI